MTVRQLVDALGVTTTAVRTQVDRLVGDGILAVAKRAGQRGRPSDVFRLTDLGRSLVGHRSDQLIDHILTVLTEQEGSKKVKELLGEVALRIANGYAQRISGTTMQEKLEAFADLLRQQGIPAEVRQVGDTVIVRQCGCPYYKLARINRSICGVHVRMLNHLVGQRARRTRCLAHGHTRCEFQLKANGPIR
jgi:predicted ArsR family transcriptional regulator